MDQAPQDVDGYNISLYPTDLLKLYHPELTLQLVSHAPTPIVRDNIYFKDYIYIAQAAGLFKIAPELKQPLLKAMTDSHLVIKPSTFPLALIKGKQAIAVGQLVTYLQDIGCNTVRLQVYGQKRKLLHLKANVGNPDHPLARLNTFDLGCMHDDPRITLVQPVQYSNPKMTLYPMLLPIGMGYGSVHMDINLGQGETYQVKAYPRLVHCIKAESGTQALWAPDTVRRARARHSNLKSQLLAMETTSRFMMGGLRLEVTVSATTLQEAISIISKTPLLNLDAYLYNRLELMHPFQLRLINILKVEYMDNFKHMMAKAETVRTFEGNNNAKLRPHKKQIILDLFNTLGWNNGRTKVTAFNAADAWWLDEIKGVPGAAPAPVAEPEAPVLTLGHIKGVPAMKALFLAIRAQLPCHSCPDPGYTYIWDGHVKQFRIKCKECGSKLNQAQARDHILHLVGSQELVLPEEYQPQAVVQHRSPTPPAEMPVVERQPTPEPAPTTGMRLRSRAQPEAEVAPWLEVVAVEVPQRAFPDYEFLSL